MRDDEKTAIDDETRESDPGETPDEGDASRPDDDDAGSEEEVAKAAGGTEDDPDDGPEPLERPEPATPAKPAPEEGSSTPLILVAGLIAAATVGGVWWWNNRAAEGDEALTLQPASSADARRAPAEADDPGDDPLAALAGLGAGRPAPIPAPDDVAAPPANATRTESGLASRVLEAGTGTARPAATDRVTVHYTGWTTDGEMFDSSRTRGEPATFPLDGVIPGWTEGVQLMVVGEKRRFWIPENLAYAGRPGAPPGMLVFDVELLSFETPPPPPPVPDDVAAVPANATRTESGLAWRVLQAGSGTEHPSDNTLARIHLTGWTTDGTMFDSTASRGEPLTVPVGLFSLPGLREGVKLMVEGERRRFWVPEDLAFAGRPGAPPGMLVFDIELVGMMALPAGMGLPGMPGGAGLPPGHGADDGHGHD